MYMIEYLHSGLKYTDRPRIREEREKGKERHSEREMHDLIHCDERHSDGKVAKSDYI